MGRVFDVAVIGAGPAGSCAAALLARAGLDVICLERDPFPRFVIGESLLPACVPVLERLGLDLAAAGFQRKAGAQFVRESAGERSRFGFGEGLDPARDHAFHVDRARFDAWLAAHASALGAELRHGARVVDVTGVGEAASAAPAWIGLEGGERVEAAFVLDASGSRALLGRKLRALEPYRGLGRAAVHARYTGIAPEVRADLEVDGDIKIMVYDGLGWGWVIPLAGGELSVGTVSADHPPDPSLYEESAGRSVLITELTRGARRGPIVACGNFSFRNRRPAGARFGCVGDAAGFLDPLFSSGVTLALLGASWCADAIIDGAAGHALDEPALLGSVHRRLGEGVELFERLVRRFYATNLGPNLLLSQDPPEALRRGLVSILGGDLWREDNEFARLLRASRGRRAARVP